MLCLQREVAQSTKCGMSVISVYFVNENFTHLLMHQGFFLNDSDLKMLNE